MRALIDTLRSGDWLTRERARLWAAAVLVASGLGLLFVVATSDGLNDYQGRPLGTDFSNVYAAGRHVLEGRPAAPYDWPAQHARERTIFGDATPFYGWHYPPYFLLIATPLATLPYPLALALWQAATLALYLLTIRAILSAAPAHGEAGREGGTLGPLWLLAALAFPAVFVNIGHGHNGFLTAALIGGALVTVDRRPWFAGLLFGLLAYKPQFGVLIPVALIATGRWRAFAAAALTVAVLTLITLFAFGAETWRAFLNSTALTRVEVLEQGGTGWHKIQSVFSIVRMWGGCVGLAYGAQAATALALAVALAVLWRSAVSFPLKAAALIVAAMLATPYSLDYDLAALAPAIAFVAAHGMARGFAPWEITALAMLWIVPLVARTVAEHLLIPLAVPAMLLLFALVMRHAADDRGAPVRWRSAAQPMR